jgi:hypothetical protein
MTRSEYPSFFFGPGADWQCQFDGYELDKPDPFDRTGDQGRSGGRFDEEDVRGEILELKETVNGMTESLSVFADEVTRVAREVGTEGRLGGQARVTNVGTWKDLTDNVNVMAANVRFFSWSFFYRDGVIDISLQLTLQVRTIAVATVRIGFLVMYKCLLSA